MVHVKAGWPCRTWRWRADTKGDNTPTTYYWHLCIPMSEVASPLPTLPITPSIKTIPKAPRPQIKIGGRKPSIAPSTSTSAASTPTSTKLKLFPSKVGRKPPAPPVMEIAKLKHLPVLKPPPVLRLAPAPQKERPLERAQANGMSLMGLKCCRTALKRLKNCKHVTIFH